jgi:hypothetical protein
MFDFQIEENGKIDQAGGKSNKKDFTAFFHVRAVSKFGHCIFISICV